MNTPTATQLLEAELPVCEICRRVGKLPLGSAGRIKTYCSGPAGSPHKPTRMTTKLFREVTDV
jgi:hypothetical protein